MTIRNIIPKLRFKESGDWKTELFEDIYSFKGTNSLSREKLNYSEGTVKNIHYGDIHTKFSTHFDITKEKVPFINSDEISDKIKEENYCIESDLIFADASEDLNDIGKSIEIINLNGEKVLSGLHTLLARQKADKLILGFAGHLFKSQSIRLQIQTVAQGTKVLGLSFGRLANITVCYPQSKIEQTKIANCLSSLDDLISAENEKLEALKEHKKGLMQVLFPAVDEKIPILRFPEFQDAGDWEEKTLGEICKFIRGPFGGALKKEIFVPIGYAVYEQSHAIYNDFSSFRYFISEEKFKELKRFTIQAGDIIMSCSGTMGKFAIVPEGSNAGVINQALLKLTVKTGIEIQFVKAVLELPETQNKLLSQSAGGAIKNVVEVAQIKEIPIFIPKLKEQNKITNLLVNLDKQIAAQDEKLESLKEHKKGLMQGLFPSL